MKLSKNKLVLGTAQLGMKYGLNNTAGQPTEKEAFSILDAALESDITIFDTAYAYGTAEDVLGKWIKERSLAGRIGIISKMKPHVINDYSDGTMASEMVRTEIEKSLTRLHLNSLDGYLFHSPHYIYLKHMIEGMQKAKDSGLVKHIGVSIYDEAEALQAAELGVDYIQVPYNVFDTRLDRTNFFEIAKKNKVTVFARSPFLQGLLLMQSNKLPKHLTHLGSHLQQFIDIISQYQLSPVEAALYFADNMCQADYIVFGVETRKQLEEDIRIMNSPNSISNNDWMNKAKVAFQHMNRGAINPSLWSKIKL